MIKLYCDICGKELSRVQAAYYFKMWDFVFADSSFLADEYPYDDSFLICNDCMYDVCRYVENKKAVEQ